MNGMRVALYERVSVLGKGETSADARSVAQQNAAGLKACEANGWAVTARYADPGRSASRFARRHREDWARLHAAVRAGEHDIVIMWEPSRGGRELEAWAGFLTACRTTRTLIYVTSHGRAYDLAEGRDWRVLAEDGVDSAYESEKISLRVRRGLKAAAEDGRPHGVTLFGYERVYDERTRQLAEQRADPETARIPAEVITRVAAREPLTVIARDLARRNVATPAGGEWNAALVRRIAVNPAYIGRRRIADGELVPAVWPALVEESVFWDAGAALAAPGRKVTRPGAYRHLLSYLAVCGPCGSHMAASAPASRHTAPMYHCRKGCTGIRQEWLDGYVTGLVRARLDDPAFWKALDEHAGTGGRQARAQADEYRARLRDFTRKAIAGEMGADSYAEIEAGLKARIAAADREADRASAPLVFRDVRGGPGESGRLFAGKSVAVRKGIIRSMFTEIAVLRSPVRGRVAKFDPARVRWEFRMPV